MKLPRDINGKELARKLERYGYHVTRQTGSHLRLISRLKVSEHHITVPAHGFVRVGTLNNILNDICRYLEKEKETLLKELFGDS